MERRNDTGEAAAAAANEPPPLPTPPSSCPPAPPLRHAHAPVKEQHRRPPGRRARATPDHEAALAPGARGAARSRGHGKQRETSPDDPFVQAALSRASLAVLIPTATCRPFSFLVYFFFLFCFIYVLLSCCPFCPRTRVGACSAGGFSPSIETLMSAIGGKFCTRPTYHPFIGRL